MKQIISVILVLCMCSVLCFCSAAEAPEMDLDAKSAVLMDLNSGKVLYALNENERAYPASITKVMSLLLVMESIESGKIKLTDMVSASENAVSYGGSQIWLEVGEQMSVDDMLKAVCVASANDACTALSEYVSGSDAAFVDAMNQRANELGMQNTHFENCTGLDENEQNHYSSAYDIALMSRALMQYDLIQKYSTIWMDSLREGKTELVNTNRLVRFYQGCIGLKTGTTTKAGYCVSAVAKRENTLLCAVILGAENSDARFQSAAKLLDYGFANFESITPQVDLSQAKAVRVKGGLQTYVSPVLRDEQIMLTVPKGEGSHISTQIQMEESVKAPLKEGEVIGQVVFLLDEEELARVDIVSREEIGKMTFWQSLKKLFESVATNLK